MINNLNPLSNQIVQDEYEDKAVSDEELKLLVDYCKKKIATVGGDGYSEVVLYQRDEEAYEIHTYSKYEPSTYEIHHSYKVTKEFTDEIQTKIKELQLAKHKDLRGASLCGGDYVLKFYDGNEFIRLTSANFPDGDFSKIYEIRKLLFTYINEENEIFK